MFRRRKHQPEEAKAIAVDVTLELDLRAAEATIEVYLREPSAELRNQLLVVLQRLDQRIDLSDDYESRIVGSAALGYSTKGSVLGETSSSSAAEEVRESEFRAQTVLIKAAKREVTAPTAATLADLRAASQALAAERSGEPPAQ